MAQLMFPSQGRREEDWAMVKFSIETDMEFTGISELAEDNSATILTGQRFKVEFRAQDWEFVRETIDIILRLMGKKIE